MVKCDLKLVKLHLEFICDRNRDGEIVSILHFVKILISNRYRDFRRGEYPVSLGSLMQGISLHYYKDRYILGYTVDTMDTDTYKKMLDVEYGVNGVEKRLVRHVLEFIYKMCGG